MRISQNTRLSVVLSVVMVGVIGLSIPSRADASEEAVAAQKSVLVTGASSGIGLKITEVLSERGVHVYAGARKEADLERLDAMENVSSVKLDVTVQSEIDAAVEKIAGEGQLNGARTSHAIVTGIPAEPEKFTGPRRKR